ncbi:MAG: metallophosphoesterase [Spirochaetaceae bacterium]
MNKNRVFFSIIALIAMINSAIYWSIRPIWIYIDQELGSFMGFNNFWTTFIMVIFILISLYSQISLLISMNYSVVKSRKKLILNKTIVILFNAIFMGLNIYLVTMLGSEKQVLIRNLLALIPGIVITASVLFFIIFFPKLNISNNIKVRVLVASIFIISLYYIFVDSGSVQITSGPYFQYVDDDNFAVLWTTNKRSTGWVEYGPDEEQLSIKYMSNNGFKQANSKTHKVLLPITSDGLILRVGSRYIKNIFQNNVVYGNSVYSNFILTEDSRNDENISFYILSDVHEREDIYKKYLGDGDYNFLVLNGDIISSIDSEEIIIDEMLKPITEYSKGFKPFYFVRGNHETRGVLARQLPNYLALPGGRYYYTFKYGPIFAIVLDAGEDKPDTHIEYGGLVDFKGYRKEETQWLKEVAESDEYKNAEYKIVFNHVPLNMYRELQDGSELKSTEKQWVDLLNSMDIDVAFSGHTHSSDLIEPEEEYNHFPIIVGGGYVDAHSGFEGLKVEVNGGYMNIKYIDEEGNTLNSYNILDNSAE